MGRVCQYEDVGNRCFECGRYRDYFMESARVLFLSEQTSEFSDMLQRVNKNRTKHFP